MDQSIYEISPCDDEDNSYFDPRVCVIGSGLAGSTHALAFSTKYRTIWFDPLWTDVREVTHGQNGTPVFSVGFLQPITYNGLVITPDIKDIRYCNFYVIISFPRIVEIGDPDFSALWEACELVGKVISGGDIVVFDSCAYPIQSEKECIPRVEKVSGLTCNNHFFAGYSPGPLHFSDKEFSFWNAGKVTSGSTPEIAKLVDEVYLNVFGASARSMPSIGDSEISGVG